MDLPFSVAQESRNIHTVDLKFTSYADEWWFLLSSDRHHDNPHCNRDLEVKHLDECVQRRAGAFFFGDTGCLMGGRYDPRRARRGIHEEDELATDYLDSVIRNAAKFYAPYARNICLVTRGNHEQSVLKNCDTDYTERLCERMSEQTKHKVYPGGYGGWVRFQCHRQNERHGLTLKYFHGAGGGALMSHGTLRVRRDAAVMPDADIVCTGHIHRRWIMPLRRERLVGDRDGVRVVQDTQHHICCGTYKDEFNDNFSGWANESGHPPHDMGAVWMRVYFSRETYRKRSGKIAMRYTLTPSFVLTD